VPCDPSPPPGLRGVWGNRRGRGLRH
jgi:hypothetical protein